METNSFKASIVFRDGDTKAFLASYSNSPVTSDEPLNLSFHNLLKVNYALAKDCHFFLYEKHNPGIDFGPEEDCVISDDQQSYNVVAFLDKIGDTLHNSVPLVTQLPKGLVIKKMASLTESGIYCFSGFNVMLFDEAPKLP